MNFKEDYKNSIEIMGPSAEQLERMKKNILEQAKAPEKKAIPFKKIAYIGGAVAACAVISVAAINIIPRLSDGSSNLTAAESFNAVGGNAFEDGAYENAAMDAAADYAPEYVTEDKSISDDVCAEPDCDEADISEDTAAPSFDPMVDYDINDEADTAADDACNDVIADVTEMTDTPTSAPVTTTAVNAGSSTDTPTEDVPASADEVQDIETEPSIYIADDLSYIDIGSEFFVGLGSEAELPEKVVDLPVTNTSYTSPDGAEYRLEFHGEGIIVLFRGDEVIGMYARLTLD